MKGTATILAVCFIEVLLPQPGWVKGALVTFMLSSLVVMVGFVFLLAGDAVHLIAGAMGEAHTQAELDAAKKTGLVWGYVPNVEASGRDVDQVVLTPSGVLALETKWRFKGVDAAWLSWAVTQAEKGARQTRLVLQAKPIELRMDVRPVVVVWGGARRELEPVQSIDGVDIVRGDHLLTWLERCSRGRLAQDHAETLCFQLTAFTASRVHG